MVVPVAQAVEAPPGLPCPGGARLLRYRTDKQQDPQVEAVSEEDDDVEAA